MKGPSPLRPAWEDLSPWPHATVSRWGAQVDLAQKSSMDMEGTQKKGDVCRVTTHLVAICLDVSGTKSNRKEGMNYI